MAAEHTVPGLDADRVWRDAMVRGDFAAAWAVNDAVLWERDPATRDDPALPYHLRWVWDGMVPDGRDVLVRCYHGLGDTLQFSRYLPLLGARAAGVTVEVQPELMSLLASWCAGVRLVPFRADAPLPPGECTLEIMEAGHVLRCVPPPLPAPVRPARARAGTLRVGVCAAGGDWDPARAMPADAVAALAEVAGVRWTNLSPGTGEGVFGPMLPPGGSVADTAAVVRGLDAVVTVDTMVAHLAGTLGVPTMVLLRAEPDWRWLPGGGARSPWYPSVRLYRQASPGAWGAVVDAVSRDLALAQSGA